MAGSNDRASHLYSTPPSKNQPAGRQNGLRGSALLFNFLPVAFTDAPFEAGTLPYESREQLDELRIQLAATHRVVRLRDRVVCVPFASDAKVMGEPAIFDTSGPNLALAAYLLQAELMRVLTEVWKFSLSKFDPLTFVSRLPGRDLMEQVLKGEHAVDGLHVYPEYLLDVRRTGPTGHPGVIVGLKTRYEIALPASELVRLGVHLVGQHVLTASDNVTERPFEDPTARRKLAGVVEAVSDDRLVLGAPDGSVEVPASQAWLEARRNNFLTVLEAKAGASATAIADALVHRVFTLTGAEGRIMRTQQIADGLIKLRPLTIANGIQATIGNPVEITGPSERKVHWRLREPTYVFDLGGDKTHRFADPGLNDFGPFDSEGFRPKIPRIAVVTPKRYQGAVEGLMSNFRNGVRGAKAFSQGFVRKYRLTDCVLVFTTFDGDVCDADAYRQTCLDAMANEEPVDLAVVITSAAQEYLTGNASPYLVAKSTFMSQGVPVQEFQVENINRDDIAYPLNTMALACYAKLGGTPYVISVPRRPMAHELVFGIGSAHIGSSRIGPVDRFVGITTVFNSDGNYLVSNVSREAPYEHYPQELLRALQSCLEEVKERNGCQPSDVIRLIFHVFKPMKDRETRAVKELVERMTKEYAGVEFAFLHVSDQHPWMMLDRSSAGVRHGRRLKGQFVPDRGHAVRIGRNELLVSVSGPRDLKLPLQGAPRPLLLKLHHASTFTDLDYLAGQVYRFTAMSWRRPYPSSQPVTILYSDLIAGLLGQLRQVTNWNSDMISTKLRWSRWFL